MKHLLISSFIFLITITLSHAADMHCTNGICTQNSIGNMDLPPTPPPYSPGDHGRYVGPSENFNPMEATYGAWVQAGKWDV
jgi:hypothetical protein